MSQLSSRQILEAELPRLYGFAHAMCGNREDALAALVPIVRHYREVAGGELAAAAKPGDVLMARLATSLEESLGRRADFSFEGLDETLRSDVTRPINLTGGGPLGGDPTRMHVMLWELKRTCLIATLCCLPPGVRISFVLTDMFGYGPVDAADLLGIKESAYRVRLTRARKRIEDYLTPRCVHVDAQNPCTCSGRLLIAMDANFVREPLSRHDIPDAPHDGDGPRRDVGTLYRSLPKVQFLEAELRSLLDG